MKQPLFFRPNLSEFYPEWKNVKLGDLATIRKGFTPSTENRSFWEGDIPWLSIAGFNEKYLKEGTKFISSQALGAKQLFPKGSLVMSFKLTLGKLGILDKPMMTNEAICYLDWKDGSINNEFAFYALSYIDLVPYANQAAAGLTLNDAALKSISIPLPSPAEQEKIAEFFSALDERIALTADKVKLLKEQKTGYLQKIFAQELVFTDDNGDRYPEWEQKKLVEIANIVTGNTPETSKPELWGDDYPWITPTDIGDNKSIKNSGRRISEQGLKKARFLPKDSLLVTCIASIGKNAILTEDGSCNQQINAILPSDSFSTEYLYYFLATQKNRMELLAGKTATSILNKTEFGKINIVLPSLPEQQKIAEFFSALDEQIELTENKLTLLKEQKKGYLQGIFG